MTILGYLRTQRSLLASNRGLRAKIERQARQLSEYERVAREQKQKALQARSHAAAIRKQLVRDRRELNRLSRRPKRRLYLTSSQQCIVCGSEKDITAHHVFGRMAPYVVPACEPCHKGFHREMNADKLGYHTEGMLKAILRTLQGDMESVA